MRKYFYIFIGFIVLCFLFLISMQSVLAQETTTEATAEPTQEASVVAAPEEVPQALEQAAETAIKEQEKPEEVKMDENVEPEDFGVQKARILPDNPFYGFKELGRDIKTFFTFDPVKKAERQIDIASAKLVEAKQLIEEKGTVRAVETAQRVITNITKEFEHIAQKADVIKKSDSEKVDKFLDKIADHQLKHQKLLQKFEEQVPEKVFTKIEEDREIHLEKFAEVMNRVAEKSEVITQKLIKAAQAQKGSEFKDFKSLEILKNLEEKMPEQAKQAISQAQENIALDLQRRISVMPEETRSQKLGKYIEFMPGHAVRQFEMLDKAKMIFDDPELIKDLEALKDKAVQKFEQKFAEFKDQEARDKFMAPLKDGDPNDMRTLMQIEMRMAPPPDLKEAMEKARQESLARFKEKFADNPEALKKLETVKRALSSPDAIDFKLIEEIESSLPPEQKEFAQELKDQVKKKMIEQFAPPPEMQDPFAPPPSFIMERFIDTSPQGLEVLKELKEELPLEAQQGIEQAIKSQVKMMSENMEKMDDPAMFERYKQEFKEKDELGYEIRRAGQLDFFEMMEARSVEMEAKQEQFEQTKQEKMQEIQKRVFETPERTLPEILLTPMIPPKIIEKAQEFREETEEERVDVDIKQDATRGSGVMPLKSLIPPLIKQPMQAPEAGAGGGEAGVLMPVKEPVKQNLQ